MVPQAVVATGEGNLVYLELGESGIEQKGHVKLDAEVACVDISPLSEDGETASLLAVGTWDMRVHIFSLPAMAPLVSEPLGGEIIPRSVLFAGEPRARPALPTSMAYHCACALQGRGIVLILSAQQHQVPQCNTDLNGNLLGESGGGAEERSNIWGSRCLSSFLKEMNQAIQMPVDHMYETF